MIFFFVRVIPLILFFIITDDYVNFQKGALELLVGICKLENIFSMSSFPETDSEMPVWVFFCVLEGVNEGRITWADLANV